MSQHRCERSKRCHRTDARQEAVWAGRNYTKCCVLCSSEIEKVSSDERRGAADRPPKMRPKLVLPCGETALRKTQPLKADRASQMSLRLQRGPAHHPRQPFGCVRARADFSGMWRKWSQSGSGWCGGAI